MLSIMRTTKAGYINKLVSARYYRRKYVYLHSNLDSL